MSYIRELRALVGHRPLLLAGVVVMVFDEHRRILLQHRTDDKMWDLPGGFMELGETAEETGRREVREETGLEIGEMTLFTVLSGKEFFFEYPNGDQAFSVCPVYVTEDAVGELQPDGEEGSEVKFFPLQDLPGQMLPQIRRLIESFIYQEAGK